MPQPLTHFVERVFQNQRTINNTLQSPQTSTLALLTLSRPVSSLKIGDYEALVMDFFDVFWIFDPHTGLHGFFDTQEEAMEYLRTPHEQSCQRVPQIHDHEDGRDSGFFDTGGAA
jgi:hypothetical protein